jgi:hypothetical protein
MAGRRALKLGHRFVLAALRPACALPMGRRAAISARDSVMPGLAWLASANDLRLIAFSSAND